jgi:TIR domain
MSTVFISYRRETAAGEARALSTDLAALLGKNSVFMDVDNIALGRDFRSELQTVLESCKVMLVIIDKDWLGVKDERGGTRLENPDDVVRLEVETGLKRDIAVTPVLVKGARMPTAEQLPPEISKLADRNAFELSHTRWKSDVRAMTERLGLVAREEAKGDRSQSNLRRVSMVSVLLFPIVIGGLIVGYFVTGILPGACDGIFEQSVPELNVKMRFIEANGEWAIGKEKIQDIDKDAQKVGMHLKACCISQEKGFMKPEQFQVCMAGGKEYEAKIVQVASNIGEAQTAKQQGDIQLAEKKAMEAKTVAGESTNVAAKVAEVAEKTSPPPARDGKPYFFDDFKGKTLAGRWEVIRPNNDSYAIEKDGLLIINSKAGSLGQDNIPNLFRLETAMPDGNWTATVLAHKE